MGRKEPNPSPPSINNKPSPPSAPPSKILNFDRHFYLYAKGFYQKNPIVLLDLKCLVAHRSGLEFKHIRNQDVFIVLTTMVSEYIIDSNKFIAFLNKINLEDSCFIAILNACLSILKWKKVSEIPFKLGEPDKNILPLAKINNDQT